MMIKLLHTCQALLLLAGCDLGLFYRSTECIDVADAAHDAFTTTTVAGTKWMYQLQNADPDTIGSTGFDVLVIDYSRGGGEAGRYSTAEMVRLKSGTTTRQTLAYLSIGEAEDYRYYFDSGWVTGLSRQPSKEAPCWLGRTNPEWKGNYKVQYWSADWQRIVLGYLDRIIDDGFDGVYLDIIDAYEYWADGGNREGFAITEEEAAVRMINFVKIIAYHARETRGVAGFLVYPQNGEGILAYDNGIGDLKDNDYLATISGIGIEDLYYDGRIPVDLNETSRRRAFLERIKNGGKRVIVVDYVDEGNHDDAANMDRISTFRETVVSDGYYPYAALTDRSLDEMVTFVGQP